MTTIGPLLLLLAATLFVILYNTRRWWESPTGWSIMTLAGCLIWLPAGDLVAQFAHADLGEALRGAAYIATAATMLWRTWAMWTVNHPKPPPPPPPAPRRSNHE